MVEQSAQAMYELVCDVDRYPEFLPWCSGAAVLEADKQRQVASVSISRYMPQSSFTTVNTLVEHQSIHMALQDGPFKHLDGTWRFTPLSDSACKIELSVDFEFSSAMVATLISPAFNRVCDSIVNAFITRAQAQNGAGGG